MKQLDYYARHPSRHAELACSAKASSLRFHLGSSYGPSPKRRKKECYPTFFRGRPTERGDRAFLRGRPAFLAVDLRTAFFGASLA